MIWRVKASIFPVDDSGYSIVVTEVRILLYNGISSPNIAMKITPKEPRTIKPWALRAWISGACSARNRMLVYLLLPWYLDAQQQLWRQYFSLQCTTTPRTGLSHSVGESQRSCLREVASTSLCSLDRLEILAKDFVINAATVLDNGKLILAVSAISRRVRKLWVWCMTWWFRSVSPYNQMTAPKAGCEVCNWSCELPLLDKFMAHHLSTLCSVLCK